MVVLQFQKEFLCSNLACLAPSIDAAAISEIGAELSYRLKSVGF
jgi:hypothetical protein